MSDIWCIISHKEKVEDIKLKKKEIREKIIRRLREQEPSLRKEKSRTIQEKLLSSEEFRLAQTVMTYVAMPAEVDTLYFIEEALRLGKKLVAPYVISDTGDMIASELTTIDDLKEGPFGILEPENGPERKISLKEIDLIVVPGVAFDKKNMRLGRGKGYYDRFLSCSQLASVPAVGLAFDFQMVDSLPAGPHDRPVSRVITG
ncbi:MAG: 5-formyltetrahydrofolate cyclo-ligase [Candidatus Omnitrophica bacterium]|nr:5-formyltetrahydrofolate cyclo-ligase [Candidatus Omnitrophota bacterium]